ncbi:MAG: DUF1127 domain-containing protein [Proteobacteria bacterium]|nr:DUF1127 domain-containing protein [Pseudomonadota bacterium]
MTSIAINRARRFWSGWGRLSRMLSALIEGIGEGRTLHGRYIELARKSDTELARIGLRREDIARAAVLGPRR